jgi:Glycosyl hydrolase family 1
MAIYVVATAEGRIWLRLRDRCLPPVTSAAGQKRRLGDVRVTSASPPKADIHREVWHVRLVPITDIYITENGTSGSDQPAADGIVYDVDRIKYLRNYLAQLQRATSEGVHILEYFLWSAKRRGLIRNSSILAQAPPHRLVDHRFQV